jgi:hypothetical protein
VRSWIKGDKYRPCLPRTPCFFLELRDTFHLLNYIIAVTLSSSSSTSVAYLARMATFQFKAYDPNGGTKKKSKPSKPSSTKPCKPPAESRPLPTQDSPYAVHFDSGPRTSTLLCAQLDDLAGFNSRLTDQTEVDDDDAFPDIYELLGYSRPGDLDDRSPFDPPSARQGESSPGECGKGQQRTFRQCPRWA